MGAAARILLKRAAENPNGEWHSAAGIASLLYGLIKQEADPQRTRQTPHMQVPNRERAMSISLRYCLHIDKGLSEWSRLSGK